MEFRFKLEKSDLITPIVLNLCDNVNQLLKANKKEGNTINLSDLQWVSPLSILPLSSLLFDLKNKGYKLNIIEPSNLNVKSYLKTIKFFEGIHSADYLKRHRNYIPIVSILNTPSNTKSREQILSSLLDILLTQIGCKQNLLNALGYTLAEMYDNIWQHSKTKYGWFLSQYYRNKKYADICFVDNGITIKGSYQRKKIRVANDAKAIELALKGKSTKTIEGRGYGLWTTKRLTTESSLRGEFLIISGQSGYYESREKKMLFNLPRYWQGTIILLRINKTGEKIDYTRYIE